jgi:hypothetical protein
MSPELSWDEKDEKMTDWAIMLQNSGYNQGLRIMIIRRAMMRYRKELSDHIEGRKMMYRTREERKKEMIEKGGKSDKGSWFRNGGGSEKITGTIRVPASKDGMLKELIEKKIKQNGGPEGYNVKVIEDGGNTIKGMLVKGDPFPRKECGRVECKVKKGECGETCYRTGANYTIPCNRCDKIIEEKEERNEGDDGMGRERDGEAGTDGNGMEGMENRYIYLGETSRSVHRRSEKHWSEYRRKNNYMWEHTESLHEGIIGDNNGREDYRLEPGRKDMEPMRRILREAVKQRRVEEMEDETDYRMRRNRGGEGGTEGYEESYVTKVKVKTHLLNGKLEWFLPKLVNVNMTQL